MSSFFCSLYRRAFLPHQSFLYDYSHLLSEFSLGRVLEFEALVKVQDKVQIMSEIKDSESEILRLQKQKMSVDLLYIPNFFAIYVKSQKLFLSHFSSMNKSNKQAVYEI